MSVVSRVSRVSILIVRVCKGKRRLIAARSVSFNYEKDVRLLKLC